MQGYSEFTQEKKVISIQKNAIFEEFLGCSKLGSMLRVKYFYCILSSFLSFTQREKFDTQAFRILLKLTCRWIRTTIVHKSQKIFNVVDSSFTYAHV